MSHTIPRCPAKGAARIPSERHLCSRVIVDSYLSTIPVGNITFLFSGVVRSAKPREPREPDGCFAHPLRVKKITVTEGDLYQRLAARSEHLLQDLDWVLKCVR